EKITKITGIYHLAGRGSVSRFEWAKEIVAQDPEKSSQILEEIIPVKSDTFPNPAIRPRFSALDCSKIESTFGIRMEPWKESLRIAMEAED
ncbi:MAG: sugar nucleotide-binding protein, partial [Candidatus Hermodarchaeia archaeon]